MGKGKPLSLGPGLRYPIVVNKLIKRPGDTIKKQEALFQYTFKWMKTVGDALNNEEWEEEQTSFADWDSTTDGILKSWKIREGMKIEANMEFVDVEEDCPHSIQFAGLCGMCGKDMTETSWASASNDTERAKINMIHDQNFLTVSEGVASKAEETLQRRLLAKRKLSLVVDLDQTIIHACIDPTVGQWQSDTSSPNYEAVKDVKKFQLHDEGPRGLTSGFWYYIKMRPGLKQFLAKVSEMFELHVYTMGTRAYALNIAKIVDPDKKLFGDRIISRDENGSMTAKSLARLFPVDTKMVVIIDDRADVWPRNRPNLIKVHPYDFFLGIGDINSSFLPKREELPKPTPSSNIQVDESPEEVKSDITETVEIRTEEIVIPAAETSPAMEAIPEIENGTGGPRVSALEELVKMGGGDDQALRQKQAVEQEQYLEKQLTERPLLHMQEKLDEEEDKEEANEEKNGDTTKEHPHHRHSLLKDDDDELVHLEKHLTQVHKAFYDEWDSALVGARGGRVAQLKPGHSKKVPMKEEGVDLSIVPDIGDVMPRLKSKVLEGTRIVLSAIVPLGQDLMRSEIAQQTASFGAELDTKVSKRVTHVVTPTNRTRTHKVRQAAKYPKIKIVNLQWLLDSISKWQRQDEMPYLIEILEQDRKPDGASSVPSSINGSEEDDDDTGSEEDPESIPASQEEEADSYGLMPDAPEGHSPIDDMKTFDWGQAEDELAEFLDSGDDSDTSSVASDTTQSTQRGVKRNHKTDDEDSEGESVTAKKQRTSKLRTTGLKNMNMHIGGITVTGIPTPGPTDENDGDRNGDGDDRLEDGGDSDDDLEADIMAEFEREAQEAEDGVE